MEGMIYLTGDTHGDIDIGKITTRSWPLQKELTRDDYLIVCGDFGAVWSGDRKDDYLLKWHENKTYTTLWVDGNHENFDALSEYPVVQWHGGKVQLIRPHVIHLMRGQIYNIGGKTFFTFGGGLSIDRADRKEGRSWWPQEAPSEEEIEEARNNLAAHHHQVDYVISHAAPQSVLWNHLPCRKAVMRLECPCEIFLEGVLRQVKYKAWFCGHYHLDTDVEEMRVRVLYREIVELDSYEPSISRTDL